MLEFWEWMKVRGKLSTYVSIALSVDDVVISNKGVIYRMEEGIEIPKQVIIGYMVEYCKDFFESVVYLDYKRSLPVSKGFFVTPSIEKFFGNVFSYSFDQCFDSLKEVVLKIGSNNWRQYD